MKTTDTEKIKQLHPEFVGGVLLGALIGLIIASVIFVKKTNKA